MRKILFTSPLVLIFVVSISGCTSGGNTGAMNLGDAITSAELTLSGSNIKQEVLKGYPDIHWWYKCEPSDKTYLGASGWGACLPGNAPSKQWVSVPIKDTPSSVFYNIYNNEDYQNGNSGLWFQLQDINDFQAVGIINLNKIIQWNKYGFKPQAAKRWSDHKILPKDAKIWREYSIPPSKAALWRGINVPTSVAIEWAGFIISNPQMTDSILKYAPAWLELWHHVPLSKNFNSAYLLMKNGITPDMAKPYFSAGAKPSDGRIVVRAFKLHQKGVAIEKSIYYAKRNVTFSNIGAYNKARTRYKHYLTTVCHGKIESIGRLIEQSPYANKGHCYLLPSLIVSQWISSKSALVSAYEIHMTFQNTPQTNFTEPMLALGLGAFSYNTSGNATRSIPSLMELATYIH